MGATKIKFAYRKLKTAINKQKNIRRAYHSSPDDKKKLSLETLKYLLNMYIIKFGKREKYQIPGNTL